ncbi:MAG: DUF3034 family protein [Acetobacteraceae bacterium]|nr:DUF3034 family protein [Acetobacteraceae bacterium]
MRRPDSGRHGPRARRPALLCAILLGLSLLPGFSRAEEEQAAVEPPRPFPELGRLVGTAGVTSLEGAGGGGLVPWALITGYGSRNGFGANLHATGVRLTDFSLGATGLAVGVADRLELSYQHQWFDTRGAGARLGLGRGYTFEQDIFGAKLRLFGDAVADQDRWWPQVSIGLQHKVSADRDVVRAVGARDAAGTDFYVAATRLFLDAGLLVNGTLRLTRANQFGLLGHGGDGHDGYTLQPELSAALLVSRRVALGAEFRARPDNLRFASEKASFSAFAAWFAGHHLSVTLAYVDLGEVANQGRQNGVYLSLQAVF